MAATTRPFSFSSGAGGGGGRQRDGGVWGSSPSADAQPPLTPFLPFRSQVVLPSFPPGCGQVTALPQTPSLTLGVALAGWLGGRSQGQEQESGPGTGLCGRALGPEASGEPRAQSGMLSLALPSRVTRHPRDGQLTSCGAGLPWSLGGPGTAHLGQPSLPGLTCALGRGWHEPSGSWSGRLGVFRVY